MKQNKRTTTARLGRREGKVYGSSRCSGMTARRKRCVSPICCTERMALQRGGRTIPLVKLSADEAGESHLAETELDAAATEFAPPAPEIYVSAPREANRWVLLLLPAGWYGDFHPAPSRQLMVLVAGSLEVTASDGEVRRFLPGSAVLVEDTSGKGHATRSMDGETIVAVVQAP